MRAAAPAPAAVPAALAGWLAAGAAILGAAALLFADGLAYVAGRWAEPEHSHGWLIPLVTGFVLWSRRGLILEARGRGAWAGTALVAGALLLLLLAQMAFVLRGPFVAFVLLLLGLGHAALGWRAMRHALLPLGFLLFAFPLPGSVAVPLSTALQLVSSRLGAGLLEALGVSVLLEGNIIDLGVYKLQVAEACSGLRYLFPLASFGFLCAWMFRAPLWGRALVLLSTVPVTIATNGARIALTGLLIEFGSVSMAEGFMHLFEGWAIFLLALGILFLEMWAIARLVGNRGHPLDLLDFDRLAGGRPAAAAARPGPAPARVPAPLVACAGLLLAAALAQGPLTAREQLVPARPGLATYPLRLGDGWAGRPLPVGREELKALRASDHLLADFARAADSKAPPVNLWVAYYGQQLGGAAIHSPKDCLPGGGWEYVRLETVEAPAGAGGAPFRVNRGLIAKGLDHMVIYYWLDMRGRKLTDDTALKLYNLWDSYALGRSDGALVRLMTPVAPGEPVEAADRRLLEFMARAVPPLEPHVGA